MRWMKIIYIAGGLGVLIWILSGVDLNLAMDNVLKIGWGMIAVLAIYLVAFYIDSLSWHLTIARLPLTLGWSYLVWRIRMVGEAFNVIVPAGGFGGEPIKAVLLKRHHAVDYREGTASLILARTVNLIGLVAFMLIGLILLIGHEKIPEEYTWLALGGFCFLSIGIGVVFSVQRYRAASATGAALRRTRVGTSIDQALSAVQDVEDTLGRFYLKTPTRFFPAVVLAFINWTIGALETYVALYLLGYPISFADAWIIESVAQMVRVMTFFIPANLGTLDGVFILLIGVVIGQPEVGVAVATVKRIRELVFVLWGIGLGSMYSLRALRREIASNEAKLVDSTPNAPANHNSQI